MHHSSEGTLDMTPETCLPQPHHVVLSVWVQHMSTRSLSIKSVDSRHESQAAFLHMLLVVGLSVCVLESGKPSVGVFVVEM